jgi:predicted nuclease of predicted toxin-antitoxin system
MKLLIDANISYRIIKLLNQAFPNSLHVSKTGLAQPGQRLSNMDLCEAKWLHDYYF